MEQDSIIAEEAAKYLKVHPETIRRWVKEKKLTAYKGEPTKEFPSSRFNVWIVSTIVLASILLIIGAFYIFRVKPDKKPMPSTTQIPQSTLSPTPVQPLSSSQKINSGFEEMFENVVKPFYQARIQGDRTNSLSYLGGNLGVGKYSRREEEFKELEEQGWAFINPNFQSFEVIYGGINPRNTDKFGTFVMRLLQKGGNKQDELILVHDSSDGDGLKIISMKFNPDGYNVLTYQGYLT